MAHDRTKIPLFGRDGVLGWVNLDEQPGSSKDAVVRLQNGQGVRVPADLIVKQIDGSYYLPMSSEQFRQAEGGDQNTYMVIPVLAEELEIGKRQVTTGTVQINKRVHQREELVDLPTTRHEVQVERVPVNRLVDAPPPVRYEGDTMIIPVLVEELVIEKRLRLKEEVRVTQVQSEQREQRRVTLREEEVEVNRANETGQVQKE
jgi:uncharacterized protein (TIGR02271 family)